MLYQRRLYELSRRFRSRRFHLEKYFDQDSYYLFICFFFKVNWLKLIFRLFKSEIYTFVHFKFIFGDKNKYSASVCTISHRRNVLRATRTSKDEKFQAGAARPALASSYCSCDIFTNLPRLLLVISFSSAYTCRIRSCFDVLLPLDAGCIKLAVQRTLSPRCGRRRSARKVDEQKLEDLARDNFVDWRYSGIVRRPRIADPLVPAYIYEQRSGFAGARECVSFSRLRVCISAL